MNNKATVNNSIVGKYSVFRASIAISIAMVMIKLLTFVREMVLATSFGAGAVTDAFVLSVSIPTVVLMFLGNAVATQFIPQYTRINDEALRLRFTNSVITGLMLIGTLFAAVFTIFPGALVYLFAPKLSSEAFILAERLLRLMVWSSISILLSGVFRAFLQINSKFFAAAISDGVVMLFVILSIIITKATGFLFFLGVGVTLGNFVSVIILIIMSRKKHLRYKPELCIRDSNFKNMIILMLPIALSSAVSEINQMVDKNLASSLDSGTISSLSYAGHIINFVSSILGVSIATAVFPRFANMAAIGNISEIKKELVSRIVALFTLLLPITIVLVLMAQPIIRTLFESGEFNSHSTKVTSECLRMYGLGIIASCLYPSVSQVFYAMKKTKIVAIVSIITSFTGIVLNLILIRFWQHQGLAFATSTVNTLYFLILLVILRVHYGALGFRKQMPEVAKIVISSALFGALIYFCARFLPVSTGTRLQGLLWISIAGTGAFALYAALLWVMKSQTVLTLLNKLPFVNKY
jgi:putative peptidoglycan lipid II flippase